MRIIKILCLLLLTAQVNVLAQSTKHIFNADLWIKGPETNLVQSDNAGINKYFNFNPAVDFSHGDFEKTYKNFVKKQSTLFVVFKTKDKTEKGLVSLSRTGLNVFITTSKVQSDKEQKITHGDPAKGMLLSYANDIGSFIGRRSGKLEIDAQFYADQNGENQIMELLYFQRVLTDREKEIVESYLAIKYGISLANDKDYYNTKYEKIWDAKESSAFNYRIAGIGRDDASGLAQRQSGNFEKDGLYFGLGAIEKTNRENKSTLPDGSFLIWGDNNKSNTLEDDGKMSKMKRIWQMRPFGNDQILETQLLINTVEMPALSKGKTSKENLTWLVIDTIGLGGFDYATARFVKPDVENDTKISYNAVAWKPNTATHFTFVQAPEFFVVNEVKQPDCLAGSNGTVSIKIVGGLAPYTIRIASEGISKSLTINEDHAVFTDLPQDRYNLEITDKIGHFQKDIITVDAFASGDVTLAAQWSLDAQQQVRIAPQVADPEKIVSYTWTSEGRQLGADKDFVATASGTYQLAVTNNSGCEKVLTTSVSENSRVASGWIIFPNPAKVSEQFFVKFNLNEPTKVSIAITDMTGKILRSKDLGTISQFEWKESLSAAGTYLIMVSKNGVTETGKLIVQ